MINLFVKLNSLINKKLVVTGSTGVVLTEGIGILLDGNINYENVTIEVNTNVTVDYFDFYSERVILNCTKNKKSYRASVSYNFILENCILESKNTNKPIEAVYVVNSVRNVVNSITLLNIFLFIVIFICGVLVGK